jgi:hypothetical protein
LDHKLTHPRHDSTACAPIGVFPTNAIVLFVETYNIRMNSWFAIRTDENCVKILDHTKAVAAEREIIGAVSCTAIAEVESLFAVERWSRVCIWNCHLADTESIHDASPVVVDVVENGTLTRVERDSESPLLPLYK